MSSTRHRWAEPDRSNVYKTERTCIHCGLVKVTRKEPREHWIEFWRNGERIEADATPPCDRIPADGLSVKHGDLKHDTICSA